MCFLHWKMALHRERERDKSKAGHTFELSAKQWITHYGEKITFNRTEWKSLVQCLGCGLWSYTHVKSPQSSTHDKTQTLTDWSVQKFIMCSHTHTRHAEARTHTDAHAQSCVTDSAGALSTVDNWDHHCAALQWTGYPRSLMFVFMYICFEGGRHKKLNSGQNKALGDPASPTDLFHGGSRGDKWSSSRWQCVDPLCDTVSVCAWVSVCVWVCVSLCVHLCVWVCVCGGRHCLEAGLPVDDETTGCVLSK